MSDYVTTGAVLGELGVLIAAKRDSTATCVTGVTLYHVTQSAMYAAIASFDDRYDSLEGRLWRTFGMKLASSVMPSDPTFQSWTMDKIKTHLEQSAVPTAPEYMTITFPDFISDVVLIYGQVANAANPSEIFTAPCMIPQSVLKIEPVSLHLLGRGFIFGQLNVFHLP
jgi:sodium/hydrogen exchanger 10/11